MEVNCPHCKRLISFDTSYAGLQACSLCMKVVNAPEETAATQLPVIPAPTSKCFCARCGGKREHPPLGEPCSLDQGEDRETCEIQYEFTPITHEVRFRCPSCKRDVSPSASRCLSCGLALVPSQCPNCQSEDLLIITPAKPVLMAPLSFAGILTSAFASAAADAMFQDYYRCASCGNEWQ
jgi:hypothetical protein